MSEIERQEDERRTAGLLDWVRLERENEQLESRVERLGRLLDTSKALVSVLSLDGVLIRIVESAVFVTHADEGILMLLDRPTNELYVKTQKGLGEEHVQTLRLRVNDSLAGQVLNTGQPLRLNEASRVVTGYQVKAVLYVPIIYREETIGVLLVDNRQSEQTFSKEDAYLLSILSDYAAIAIKNARMVEDLKLRNRLLVGWHKTGRSAPPTMSLDRVLNEVAKGALEALEADVVVLYEYDRAQDNIILPPIVQGRALEPEILQAIGKIVPHKQSVVFKMISRGRPFYAPNAREDWGREGLIDLREKMRNWDLVAREDTASSAGVVLATDGETVGVVFASYRSPRPFSDKDRKAIGTFADQAATTIQNARLISLEQEQIRLLDSLMRQE